MDEETRQLLIKYGSEARARGESDLANPYLKNVTEYTTAGRLSEWIERYNLWSAGWKIEDLIRQK